MTPAHAITAHTYHHKSDPGRGRAFLSSGELISAFVSDRVRAGTLTFVMTLRYESSSREGRERILRLGETTPPDGSGQAAVRHCHALAQMAAGPAERCRYARPFQCRVAAAVRLDRWRPWGISGDLSEGFRLVSSSQRARSVGVFGPAVEMPKTPRFKTSCWVDWPDAATPAVALGRPTGDSRCARCRIGTQSIDVLSRGATG